MSADLDPGTRCRHHYTGPAQEVSLLPGGGGSHNEGRAQTTPNDQGTSSYCYTNTH